MSTYLWTSCLVCRLQESRRISSTYEWRGLESSSFGTPSWSRLRFTTGLEGRYLLGSSGPSAARKELMRNACIPVQPHA